MPGRWVTADRLVAGALLAGALLVGCSSSADSLDRAATQRQVGRAVAAEVEPAVAATTCPGHLEQRRGGTFSCSIRLGGGAGTLHVTVRQADDEGRLEVSRREAVLAASGIAASLKADLRDTFDRSFQVDCGDAGWKVRKAGDTLTCTARDRSSRRLVEVTVVDASGTLRFDVQPGFEAQGDGTDDGD